MSETLRDDRERALRGDVRAAARVARTATRRNEGAVALEAVAALVAWAGPVCIRRTAAVGQGCARIPSEIPARLGGPLEAVLHDGGVSFGHPHASACTCEDPGPRVTVALPWTRVPARTLAIAVAARTLPFLSGFPGATTKLRACLESADPDGAPERLNALAERAHRIARQLPASHMVLALPARAALQDAPGRHSSEPDRTAAARRAAQEACRLARDAASRATMMAGRLAPSSGAVPVYVARRRDDATAAGQREAEWQGRRALLTLLPALPSLSSHRNGDR